MGLYKERKLLLENAVAVATNDVTIFNWTGTDTTLTPTRVDTATAGTATGNIVFSATDATAAANIQTAIQALGGIYADATCVAGATADNMVITVLGGYDITWAKTGGAGTITETGAAGSDTAVVGSVAYTGYIPIGRFGIPKRMRLAGFNDNSLDIVVTDQGGGTGYRTVFSKTAVDCSTASADTPYDHWLAIDGVSVAAGAAVASTKSSIFEGPLKVVATTSAPIDERAIAPYVLFVVEMGRSHGLKMRSTGAMASGTTTQELTLGADWAKIDRIYLKTSTDTSVTMAIADAFGKNVYTKSSTDWTTATDVNLSGAGVDQGATAVADMLDVVAKSPLTLTVGTFGGGGTMEVRDYTVT